MYCDRRGNGKKPTRTKPPDKNLREQLRYNLYRGLLSRIFVLGRIKIGGVPGCVTKCDRGRGVKIGQKWRDVLYGRPLSRPTNYLFSLIVITNCDVLNGAATN